MPSFTSIFREGRYFIVMIGAVFLSFTLNALYVSRFDPEIQFWTQAIEEKVAYASEFDKVQKFVFVGGSSCAFSIDCEEFKNEHKLAAVNMGIHAGAGRKLQLELGLQSLRPGDILVLAFETSTWVETDPFRSYPFGAKLKRAISEMLAEPIGSEIGLGMEESLWDMRIGSRHLVTRLAKFAIGRPPYRYSESTIKAGGYLVFDREWPELRAGKSVSKGCLSLESRAFLTRLGKLAEKREFGVVISLPWKLLEEDLVEKQRSNNRDLVDELSKYFEVMHDSKYGAVSDRKLYSDSFFHLTREGAKLRGVAVARELKKLDL